MASTKKAWPFGLRMSSPTHFGCTLSGEPLLVEIWGKMALSKNRAAAMVMRARPRPRSRSEATARTTATAPAATAPTSPPRSRLRPRWLASWAAVKAPTPASVAWHSESCPPMPVIRVMDRKITEKASPALNTFSHVLGIQVSMDTMNAASSTYQRTRMIRSIWGARTEAVVGGRRRVDRGHRVLGVAELAQPGDDEEGGHQHDEGEGREGGRRPHAAGRQVAGQHGVGHPQQDADHGGDGHGAQDGPGGGGEGGHHQGGVVLGLELAVERGEEDTGQSGHEAGDGPGHGHHPAGVDPVQLDQAAALHRAAHLQAERGQPHQDDQGQQDEGGDHDGAQVRSR